MTRLAPILLVAAGAAVLLVGCTAAPKAAATAAPDGALPAGYGAWPDKSTIPPVEARPIAPPATSANAARQVDVVDPSCTTARFEGSVGNCLEPSLIIDDTCAGRQYTIGFNACHGGEVESGGLVNGYRPVTGVTRTDLTTNAKHVEIAKAIRGTIGSSELSGSSFPYDVEIDFAEGDATKTTRLQSARTTR